MKIFNYTLLTVFLFLVSCTSTEKDVVGDITLLVSTNVRGQLDPCGWKKNPLGGLSRKSTYVKQLNNKGKNLVILDAGDLLFNNSVLVDEQLEADKLRAQTLIKGYETIGCDVVNIGGFDLAAGIDYLTQVVDSTNIPFISANIIDSKTKKSLFPPHHIIKNSDISIGVIGLTNLLPSHVREVKIEDFISVGKAQIAELRNKVDIIVVLANVNRDKNKIMNEEFVDADYIFISRNTVKTRPGAEQPLNGPFTYGSNIQGKYLAQIDISITEIDSPLVDVSNLHTQIDNIDKRLERFQNKDPNKSLEDIYADQPRIIKLIGDLTQNRETFEKNLQIAKNTSSYKSVPLSRKIEDDQVMLAYVTDVLQQCEALTKTKPKKNLINNPKDFEKNLKKGFKSGWI